MTLNDFVNMLLKEVGRFSDERLLAAPIFIRTEHEEFEVADIDVRMDPVLGCAVAYIDMGGKRSEYQNPSSTLPN